MVALKNNNLDLVSHHGPAAIHRFFQRTHWQFTAASTSFYPSLGPAPEFHKCAIKHVGGSSAPPSLLRLGQCVNVCWPSNTGPALREVGLCRPGQAEEGGRTGAFLGWGRVAGSRLRPGRGA